MRRSILPLLALLAVALSGCGASDREPASGVDVHKEIPPEGFLPGARGLRVHYRVLGSAPDTVVAVHGGPGAGMNAILPELEPLAERHTLIFYDQMGGGLSELPADTTLLGPDGFVEELEAVRHFFGLERMKLIAHSFGAILVARYAEEHADRIERMVFFGAVGPSRDAAAVLAREGSAPADPPLRRRLDDVMGRLLSGTSPDPVADCREYESIGREMALARGESGKWKGTNCAMPSEAVRYYFRITAQLGPRGFGDWDFTRSLGEVEAPLLVIYGDSDSKAAEAQRAWAAALPRGRLLLLPGGGKGISADRPDLFYPAVETFLDGGWPAGAERVEEGRAKLQP